MGTESCSVLLHFPHFTWGASDFLLTCLENHRNRYYDFNSLGSKSIMRANMDTDVHFYLLHQSIRNFWSTQRLSQKYSFPLKMFSSSTLLLFFLNTFVLSSTSLLIFTNSNHLGSLKWQSAMTWLTYCSWLF